MLNDNINRTVVNNDFIDICMDIQNIIEIVSHDKVILSCAWNTDPSRNTAPSEYLQQCMEFTQTKCSWQHSNSVKEDTCYGFNENERSCIDYFYCLKDCIMILYGLLLYGRVLTYLHINLYFLLLRQGVLAEAR